jgi:hypothetical protein
MGIADAAHRVLGKHWFLSAVAILCVGQACFLFLYGGQSRLAGNLNSVPGEVRDPDRPVAGALVRFRGCLESTTTDSLGRFVLPHPIAGNAIHVTAWKPGYRIAESPVQDNRVSLQIRPYGASDNANYSWVAPQADPAQVHNCANCHAEIYAEWARSGHAHSATNRFFLSLYAGTDWEGRRSVGWNLTGQHADGVGVCAACHAPTVRCDDSAYLDLRQCRGIAAQGIHCDFCHKIQDVRGALTGQTHGAFAFQLLRPQQGQLFLGPLDDVAGNASYAPVYRESRYCAPCHEGILFGVHAYSTYSEWRESPAARRGQSCQSCHMAPTGNFHNMAASHGGVDRDPATLASHVDPAPREPMLRRCLSVQTNVAEDNDGVRVQTSIRTNDVGHRLPTGYIDRQLLLVVQAHGVDGRDLSPRTGPRLPSIVGKLAGSPGKLYARQPRNSDGSAPAPTWLAQPEMEDSRLQPDQPDYVSLLFPADARHIRVRLLYRRFWEQVSEEKHFPATELTIVDRTYDTPEQGISESSP